jgi:hypothetical protein
VNAEFGKIADMRPDRLLEELKRIRNLARTRPGDIEDKAAYEQRLQLVKSRLESIARLVARNEEAITELERSTPMFLGTSHDGEFAEVGPETSLSRLKELAGKIHASQQLE